MNSRIENLTAVMPDTQSTCGANEDGVGKSKYKLPVSRAFYKRIKEKARKIIAGLSLADSAAEQLHAYISNYINNGVVPECPSVPDAPYIVFSVLRLDIDEAMKRSVAARRRAAERREARKLAGNTASATAPDSKLDPDPQRRDLPDVFEKNGVRFERHGDFYLIYPPSYRF